MTVTRIPVNQTVAPSVAPAPTGDELDALIHECCQTIEAYFTARKKLSPEFQPRDGVHSTELMQGQQSWSGRDHHGVRGLIQNGTLRDDNEMVTALRKMMAGVDYKIAMRKIESTWQFDNDALVILGSYFGVDGAPTSREELWAQREEQRRADAEREAERDIERKQKRDEYARSPEGRAFAAKLTRDDFKREQLRIVLDALFPKVEIECQNILDLTDEERLANKSRFATNHAISDESRTWEPILRRVVEKTDLAASAVVKTFKDAEREASDLADVAVRIDDEFNPIEFERRYIMESLNTVAAASLQGNPAQLTKSSVPPAIDGVERVTAEKYADLKSKVEEFVTKGYTLDMRRDFEGLVLTGIPNNMCEQWAQHCRAWDEMVGEGA